MWNLKKHVLPFFKTWELGDGWVTLSNKQCLSLPLDLGICLVTHPKDLQEFHGASSKSLDGNSSSSMIRTSHLDDANSPTEGTLATHGICHANLTEKRKHCTTRSTVPPTKKLFAFQSKRSERPRHSALVQSRIHNTIKRIFQNDIEFQCSVKVVVADNFNPCSLENLTSRSTLQNSVQSFWDQESQKSEPILQGRIQWHLPLGRFLREKFNSAAIWGFFSF